MLDAFIIEKIRREREQQERERPRLPMHRPELDDRTLEPRPEREDDAERDGGAVIVDFTI
ncbi:MAG: hypothetical protein H6742_10495 [Alphaproteobacteria bacterium]|nr:hypothetical protein [Alphaproteobacteria bacterium]